MSIKLSIMVATVPNRIDFFYPKIMKSLINQTKKYNDVELIAMFDNKKRTIGKKRQDMIDLSQGDYVVFVDDDDRVSDDYVDKIMTALYNNPTTDCVVFDAFTRINGDAGRRVRFGIEYENYNEGNELRSKPSHTCVYKSEIAKKHKFVDINRGEDINWMNRACKGIKNQTKINDILYFYDAEYNTTSETTGLSDDIIQHNIQSKLMNEYNIKQHEIQRDLSDNRIIISDNNTNDQSSDDIAQNILDNKKYSITIAVRDESMAIPIFQSLSPIEANVLVGNNYPSFSKLVNTVIVNSTEEIVIFCSHRVRPTIADVHRLIKLLARGYGFVGLYRLAFFGFKKELIRRIGFFDENFIGGWYEDDDFVVRLREADIAYYESETVEYHAGTSLWNHSLNKQIFDSKWNIHNNTISRRKPEQIYDYDLGINEELKNIETKKLFLSWGNSDGSTAKNYSLVNKYNYLIMNRANNINVRPIHLRNIPPPMETFDHPTFLADFAKWLKPTLYVEFGVRTGSSLVKIAPYCTNIHGIDISPMDPIFSTKFPYFKAFQMTTDDYVANVLRKPENNITIDMIFIDACHESNQVYKDFEGIFPYVMEDGFIFLHDTYPYDMCMTHPGLCNDCYKVPYMIKNKYSQLCEMVTLPFNPGLTIIKKKTTSQPACFVVN